MGPAPADPCKSPGAELNPACMIVDLIDPPSDPPSGPPPDNRPTCDSYKKTGLTDDKLRGFNPDPDCKPPNSLSTWLEQERTKFCENINNFEKDPGGGKCSDRLRGQELAKRYCGTSDRIKSKSEFCTRTYLGDTTYTDLAVEYCLTPEGKADPWCSCYNVTNGVCDADSNAAGCPEKASSYDILVAKTPEAFKTAWSGREACYGLVCQGNKYIPENANQNCSSPIQICGYTIDAENLNQSTIDAKCNIGGQDVDQDGNPIVPPENSDTYLAAQLRKYIPISPDDLTGDDINKKIGVGVIGVGGSAMIFVCILILLSMTASSNTGPTRFRR